MQETYGVTVSLYDSQGKLGSSSVPTNDNTFNGSNLETFITALKSAVEATTLGQSASASRTWKTTYSTDSPANSAQRHSKWLVVGVDESFNTVTLTIPTADPALEDPETGQMAVGAVRTALEDALTDIWRHPITGQVITISSITLVGRTGV